MLCKEWAKLNGVTTQTVQRWCNTGKMPCEVEKIGKLYLIHDPRYEDNNKPSNEKLEDYNVVCYARVSSGDQINDLEKQLKRLNSFANKLGYKEPRLIKEIGSGMNENRNKINNILSDPTAKLIIVEHRDRFARINTKLIQSTLEAQGRELLIIDNEEIEDDLVRDITEIMTSFCARLYGKRGAKNRAERAMKAVGQDV